MPPFQRSCVVHFTESAVEKMRQITAEARRRGKVCGLFESGAIGGALPDYYDFRDGIDLASPMKSDKASP